MRLPDNEDMQRVIPNGSAPVVRHSDVSIGSGLRDLGSGLGQLAERRATFETAKARSQFLTAQTEYESSLATDRDYETMTERYEANMREQLETAAQSIKNPRARATFLEANEVRIAEGLGKAQRQAFAVESDIARAETNEQLNALNMVGLEGDPQEAIDNMEQLLAGGVEAGYYTAEEAGNLDRAWRDTFASNSIAQMNPDRALEALAQPWAQNVPAETRAKLLTDALTDQRKDRAVRIVDGFIRDGLSARESDRRIRMIEDRELREEVERRRDYDFAQVEALKVEQQDQVFEAYGDRVRRGEVRVSDIPRDKLEVLDQSQINALENIESAQAKGTDVKTDSSAYNEFHLFMDRGDTTGALNYLNTNVDKFSRSDYRSLRSKLSTALSDDAEVDDIKSSMTLTQAIGGQLERVGLGDDPEALASVRYRYDQDFREYQRLNGKEPPPDWRDQKLGELTAEVKLRRPGAFNDRSKRVYEIDQIGTIPSGRVQAVLDGFNFQPGDDATEIDESAVQAAYDAAMGYLLLNGVREPSPTLLTRVIREKPWDGAER